jgi:putative MFS transporter
MGIVAGAIMVPAVLSMALVAMFGRETRGHDLRDLEAR